MSGKELQLPVMETFYTIQGEGFYAGTPAFFIRLAGCDVGCTWCDVKDSWDASAHPRQTSDALAEQASSSGAPLVVVTGGEPAMHDLGELTRALKARGLRTHIETSGVYPLSGSWDWVTFSPKKFRAPDSGIYATTHELKVVVFHPSDLEWAAGHAQQLPAGTSLFLQPEWERRDRMTPLILDFIRQNPQWRLSVQVHKYIGVD